MNKGTVILFVIGAAFAYFATWFANNASTSPSGYDETGSINSGGYERYMKEDSSGDKVLDLSGLPLNKAKIIWNQSSVMKDVLSKIPDFDVVRGMIENRLAESEFKKYILKKLSDLGDKYLSGEIDTQKVKNIISNLK